MKFVLLFISLISVSHIAAASQDNAPENPSRKSESVEVQKARERVEELEREQRALMKQVEANDAESPSSELQSPEKDAIKRREEEIQRYIDEYSAHSPHRTVITPSTKSIEMAVYYKDLQQKIEKIGTCKFPEKDGAKIYGNLIVYIPIFQDGKIYEKDGGPRVEKSSGNPDLDKAALKIVRKAAPFSPIPHNLRTPKKQDVWEVITRFNFTHEDESDTPDVDCSGVK